MILTGQVEQVDARKPADLARQLSRLPGAGGGLARYAVGNASDLLAFAGDTVTGKLGRTVPPLRVLFGLEPIRAILVENDAVSAHWGGWTDDDLDPSSPAGDVPSGGESAVCALPGPVPLPARWSADERLLFVAPALLALLQIDERFPLSVAVDDYRAPGPAAKQGTLLRGTGRIVPGKSGVIEVDTERRIDWDGVDTSAVAAAD